MIIYKEKNKCCGCSACKNICPKQCISMVSDEEGFLYPVVDEDKCIKCNQCVKVCPYNKEQKEKKLNKEKVYAAVNKNIDIVKNSTSGGSFTGIVEAYCDENFIIFGATVSNEIEVKHIYIESLDDMDKLRGSKYVQSNMGNSFSDAKKFLDEGKKVIFTGTPCQIAGLNSYLKKNYENLLTIDIVCHGVPSPLVFNKYKKYMEEKYKSKIKSIEFRDKSKKWDEHKVTIKFENERIYSKRGIDDTFEKGFYNHYFNRPSCYSCPFSSIPRYGDFTIGDFWGVDEFRPELYDNKGISVLLLNTKKAENLFIDIQKYLNTTPINLEEATKYNPNIITHSKYNPKRKDFMDDFKKKEFYKIRKKYLKERSLVRKILSRLFGEKSRRKIKKRFCYVVVKK